MYIKEQFGGVVAALVLLISGLFACQEQASSSIAYQEQIKAWQESRNTAMRDSSSWLSLAGLFWLEEGESTFGSDTNQTLVFPPSAPAFAGTFTLKDSIVSIEVAEGIKIKHQGQWIQDMPLRTDAQSETSYLQMGSLNFYVIHRPEGWAIRVKDSQNPALLAFVDIPNFPIDQQWQVSARLDWYDPPRPIQIPTVLGSERSLNCPAKLIFEIAGHSYELSPYQSDADDPYWTIIFSDLTNGESTYGGGRFLVLTAPPAGTESMVLDFNQAYNPPCAFSPYATCPLPPPENRLSLAIPAGEQMYGEMH